MVELQTRTVKKPKSHFTICKEKNFKDKNFEVIKYIDSYRRRSDNELFELNVFNPVLEKYKLKKIYEKMFEEDLDNKSLRRLIRIIELSFNIRIFKISNLIFDRNGKIKKEEYKDSFEYIYSLWQSGKIY